MKRDCRGVNGPLQTAEAAKRRGFVVECGAGVAREGLQDWGMSSFFSHKKWLGFFSPRDLSFSTFFASIIGAR